MQWHVCGGVGARTLAIRIGGQLMSASNCFGLSNNLHAHQVAAALCGRRREGRLWRGHKRQPPSTPEPQRRFGIVHSPHWNATGGTWQREISEGKSGEWKLYMCRVHNQSSIGQVHWNCTDVGFPDLGLLHFKVCVFVWSLCSVSSAREL